MRAVAKANASDVHMDFKSYATLVCAQAHSAVSGRINDLIAKNAASDETRPRRFPGPSDFAINSDATLHMGYQNIHSSITSVFRRLSRESGAGLQNIAKALRI